MDQTLLQVDDHKGWISDTTRTWTSNHGIQLEISPGQAHTRLGVHLNDDIKFFNETSSYSQQHNNKGKTSIST